MVNIVVRHTFDVDAETFWNRMFFDEDFNRALYEGDLGFKAYDVLESREEADGVRVRRVFCEPANEAPAAVRRLMGDAFSYEEAGRWDPGNQRYRFEIHPSRAADKVNTKGEFWLEPRGDKQVDRVCEVQVEAKIFGVGRVLEGFIEKSTRDSYNRAAVFTQRYIREQGL